MKKRLILAVTVVIALVVVTSCARAPREALDAARAALETAKSAQADIYFPAEFAELNDSLAVMLQNIETRRSKSASDFRDIRASAETIVEKAGELTVNIEERKAEVKAEAGTMINDARALIDEARALIARAPRGKEGKAAIDEMTAELAVLESSITDAQSLFDEGSDYIQVVDKVKAAGEGVGDIISELKNAMQKAGIRF